MKKLFVLFCLFFLLSCQIQERRQSYYNYSNSHTNSDFRYVSNRNSTVPEVRTPTDTNIFPKYESQHNNVSNSSFEPVIFSASPLLRFNKDATKYTIALDPGHGGKDPGGSANGIIEKHIVLDVALRVKKYLTQNKFNVVLTRETDVYPTLQERVHIAYNSKADFMISIHANTIVGKPEIKGTLTIYPKLPVSSSIYKNSKRLADTIEERFKINPDITSRGPVCDYRGLYILRNAKVPTVITEIGFMTNKAEAELLKTDAHKDKISIELYNAIVTYLNNN